MTLKDYTESVVIDLQDRYDIEVMTKQYVKHADVTLTGLCLTSKDTNISPVVYIDEFYNKKTPVGEAANRIYTLLTSTHVDFDIDMLKNFESCKSCLRLSVASETSSAYICDCAFVIKRYNLYFYPVIFLTDNAMASVKVTKSMLEIWDMNADDVYNIAVTNTMNAVTIKPMTDVIEKLTGGIPIDVPDGAADSFYVVSNTESCYGAAILCVPNVIAKICTNLGLRNVCIIPSSRHEILLIDSTDVIPEAALQMVIDVNHDVVDEEDVLADSVYLLDVETEKIQVYSEVK